jgi:ferric-dicitrate binding protein FerR (iron transport regulator)
MSEFNSMEDLVFSRSFRNWVLNQESPEKSFWENWIERNPDKADMIKYAKAVIYALHFDSKLVPAEEIDEEVRKALARLKEAPRYIPLDGPDGHVARWRGVLRSPRTRVLAVLAIVAAIGGYFYYRAHSHRDVLPVFLNSHKPVQEETAGASTERELNLPDGSLVRLGKGSKLYFPREWAPGRTQREVFLEGAAFFDIRRNVAAPFFVYTDEVITKVLGASFWVQSYSADTQTIVMDKMGRVLVYRQEDFYSPSAEKGEPAGEILTPNQLIFFDRKEDRLYKKLVEKPEPLGRSDTLVIYQRTPIRQVFSQLQEEYGIPIQFDGEALDSCLLTAVVEAGPYYKKLDQICKAIGGAYEVIDGNIVVTAVGCR